jgi:YaiO family outer membrane protein
VSIAAPAAAQSTAVSPSSPAWHAEIRQRAAANDRPGALGLAEARLVESPDDLEARGWRARVLGWMGRWQEAEHEYRRVLERAPKDVDILIGLGRTLRALERPVEARDVFRAALSLDPGNADARQGLASVRAEPRHQLVIGGDIDRFNFTSGAAQAYSGSLRSVWAPRWSTVAGARFDRRFGADAARWTGSVTAKLNPRSALTIGASVGRDGGIVSRGELFVDVGRGFAFDRSHVVRGVEVNIQQRRLWFDAADVLTIAPTVLVYLPRDWLWSVSVTAARSSFPDVGAEWRPAGQTRVTFPLTERVTGHVLFAAGTENFALADQIGRFSARTFGGGARVRLPDGREIGGYLTYQTRTHGRTQTSVGLMYGVRF